MAEQKIAGISAPHSAAKASRPAAQRLPQPAQCGEVNVAQRLDLWRLDTARIVEHIIAR
jgi:hypothetical protein